MKHECISISMQATMSFDLMAAKGRDAVDVVWLIIFSILERNKTENLWCRKTGNENAIERKGKKKKWKCQKKKWWERCIVEQTGRREGTFILFQNRFRCLLRHNVVIFQCNDIDVSHISIDFFHVSFVTNWLFSFCLPLDTHRKSWRCSHRTIEMWWQRESFVQWKRKIETENGLGWSAKTERGIEGDGEKKRQKIFWFDGCWDFYLKIVSHCNELVRRTSGKKQRWKTFLINFSFWKRWNTRGKSFHFSGDDGFFFSILFYSFFDFPAFFFPCVFHSRYFVSTWN